jgi:hypothetical protein
VKTAQANSSQDPISRKPLTHTHTHKKTGGMTQSVGPEFKPQYHKNQKRISRIKLNPRTIPPTANECTFFSSANGTFSRINHMIGHKTSIKN